MTCNALSNNPTERKSGSCISAAFSVQLVLMSAEGTRGDIMRIDLLLGSCRPASLETVLATLGKTGMLSFNMSVKKLKAKHFQGGRHVNSNPFKRFRVF